MGGGRWAPLGEDFTPPRPSTEMFVVRGSPCAGYVLMTCCYVLMTCCLRAGHVLVRSDHVLATCGYLREAICGKFVF